MAKTADQKQKVLRARNPNLTNCVPLSFTQGATARKETGSRTTVNARSATDPQNASPCHRRPADQESPTENFWNVSTATTAPVRSPTQRMQGRKMGILELRVRTVMERRDAMEGMGGMEEMMQSTIITVFLCIASVVMMIVLAVDGVYQVGILTSFE